MAELGMIAPQGRSRIKDLIAVTVDGENESIPALAKAALRPLVEQLWTSHDTIKALDGEIMAWHKSNDASQRLAAVPDPSFFRSGREFAAWVGLTPRQNSSGGKEQLGQISKQGNRYIRRLLVTGATSMLRYARAKTAPGADWVNSLLVRRPARLVTVAMANKTARIAWALLAKHETYRVPAKATSGA